MSRCDRRTSPAFVPVDLTSGKSFAAIHRWIANGQIDDAARARARQHSLEHQATEDATLLGALIDLAERGRPVTASATRQVTGPVVAVGADFVILRDGRLGDVFVPVERLAVVRPAPGGGLPTGNRLAGISLTLGSALMKLASERPDVILAPAGKTSVARCSRSVPTWSRSRSTGHGAIDCTSAWERSIT
ncbi:MAG: hypothetical protein P8I99_09710 [Acidimicrobiales bacterium]|nr:hypothetical protein [Acidimicrobiales bacterium]